METKIAIIKTGLNDSFLCWNEDENAKQLVDKALTKGNNLLTIEIPYPKQELINLINYNF